MSVCRMGIIFKEIIFSNISCIHIQTLCVYIGGDDLVIYILIKFNCIDYSVFLFLVVICLENIQKMVNIPVVLVYYFLSSSLFNIQVENIVRIIWYIKVHWKICQLDQGKFLGGKTWVCHNNVNHSSRLPDFIFLLINILLRCPS